MGALNQSFPFKSISFIMCVTEKNLIVYLTNHAILCSLLTSKISSSGKRYIFFYIGLFTSKPFTAESDLHLDNKREVGELRRLNTKNRRRISTSHSQHLKRRLQPENTTQHHVQVCYFNFACRPASPDLQSTVCDRGSLH